MPGTNLTREEAATRAALVTVDRHDVELDVTTGPETFSTRSTIRFTCARAGRRDLRRLRRRHRRGDHPQRRRPRPGRALRRQPDRACRAWPPTNVVVVAATGRYTNTGEGLHRFVDPVDDEVYLYSQFEVPDSRRMYPVFEQPDLKAPLHLHGHRAGPLAGRLQLPHARSRSPPARAPPRGASPPPGRSRATSPPSSPAPTTSCATPSTQPRAARCRSASSAAGR